MSTSRKAPVPCTNCGSMGTLECAQCQDVQYCSSDCHLRDWPTHKLLCSSFRDFRDPPGPMFRRAILFSVYEEKPKFIWVEVELEDDRFGNESEDDNLGHKFELPKIGNLLGAQDLPQPGRNIMPMDVYPFIGTLSFQTNVLQNRALDHTTELVFRNCFLLDGSFQNKSVITTTKMAHAHMWAGPIVVFRKKGIDDNSRSYDDMTLADFRHTVDYFVTYNNATYHNEGRSASTRGDGRLLTDSFIKMSLNSGTLGKEGGVGIDSFNEGLTGGAIPKVQGVRINYKTDVVAQRGDKSIPDRAKDRGDKSTRDLEDKSIPDQGDKFTQVEVADNEDLLCRP